MSYGTRKTLKISLIAACATLYAVGAYSTAYIESPWGRGQFRPAIVIPLVFATLFDWTTGAFGGALGTFIADSIKHGQIYIPSLIAAVPGHLVAFLIFGIFTRKKFTWYNFVLGTLSSLLLGNFVTALLYVWFVFGTPYIGLVIGLTGWWYVTMLPFALLITPPLVRVTASALKTLVRKDVYSASILEAKIPTFFALLISGLVFTAIGITMFIYPAPFSELFNIGKFSTAKETATQIMTWMFTVTGVLLSAISFLVLPLKSKS